ncbi:MAG: energy transducer TonB [Cyclobacteriaceae bacterium]|nr:energy transducer TonB [Cyclobacteriaceae bacterium]
MELKKNPKLDYRKKSALFFNVGLVLSLLMVISAFEWKFVESISVVAFGKSLPGDEIITIPITEHKPPLKPPLKQIMVIDIVDDDIEIEKIDVDFDAIEVDVIEDVISSFDDMKEEDVDVVHDIVESMPSFEGGISEFYKFVGKNLKYPAQARRMGIEGKVFVHFVVDKDGSLSDIKVVRGIGAGCDAEVLRIIHKSPKWNPGKQRGRPVRVRMMLPITFKLQ